MDNQQAKKSLFACYKCGELYLSQGSMVAAVRQPMPVITNLGGKAGKTTGSDKAYICNDCCKSVKHQDPPTPESVGPDLF